jgi:adenosine deaminase
VRRALEVRPARIAHGATAAEDPGLMDELRARGVTLDLCPTSNVQASIYPTLADFPLRLASRRCPDHPLLHDDRTVSDLTLVREYDRAVDVLGVTPRELWAMNLHALRVVFCSTTRLRAPALSPNSRISPRPSRCWPEVSTT